MCLHGGRRVADTLGLCRLDRTAVSLLIGPPCPTTSAALVDLRTREVGCQRARSWSSGGRETRFALYFGVELPDRREAVIARRVQLFYHLEALVTDCLQCG